MDASRSTRLLPRLKTACLIACLLIPVLPRRAVGQAVPNYRDPQGRFTLNIPPDWKTAQMNSDAVQFSAGAAYVTMLVLPGTNTQLMIDSIATSTGKQWKNFVEQRRGTAAFGGRSGSYLTYSGVNPVGSDSYLQILGVTDGSLVYVMMTSAPKADFTRLKGAFDQIERSFTLSVAARVPDAPPPIPAGARPSAAAASSRPVATPATTPPAPRPGQTAASAAPAGSGDVYRMKLVRIVDERGFERPMTALTLLIPVDWNFQGSVQYGQGTGCHANLVHLVFRAASPDGKLAVELLPGNTWQWTDDLNMRTMMQQSNQQMSRYGVRGCDIMAPMTADQFLRQTVIPALRRSARIAASEPLPDAAQRLQEEAAQAQQDAARQGIRASVRTDAGRVRLTDVRSGVPVEEWLTAMTSSLAMPGPSFDIRTGRAGQAMYYTNSADHVFATMAPQGQLDAQEKLFRLMMGTVRVDPQWQARVQQVVANLQAQDTQGANARSAIATKAGQDMSKIIHDTYQNATASREHSMEGWSQYMRGVQTFRNPNTGETVELSNQYGSAWAGPDSTYVLSGSPDFNPNSALQGNWTRLESVPR